ncbi:hypothetical protein A6V36_08840 [Paraburkholderia ginsengiterrae]|uniref:Uncharacterized protein n=1 Tax=Paraburkholderia ginsengiterrae TaxID=1462993 RepID=A0A1A9N7S0_9BURK|nr:hypothetical protein [Paraburkholderia ginsengiterrae]OAJ54929.1 hypothetical protein A6V36_08840 [Paraburkholderia ginsengiterrae]OAJ61113.1 hypothetical protein A6V37_03175 [Paraburkholderia ginsengiterrae]
MNWFSHSPRFQRLFAATACATLLAACIPTDIVLAPNEASARVRFRFVGNGTDDVLQYTPAKCHFKMDPATRSLAFITYQHNTLNLNSALSPPPKLDMPNDIPDVSKLTYAEVRVRAGIPLEFGSEWSKGNGYVMYSSAKFAQFTPEASADYDVTTGADIGKPIELTVTQLKVVDGRVERLPVAAITVPACKSL